MSQCQAVPCGCGVASPLPRPSGDPFPQPTQHRLTAQQVPSLHWISRSQACRGRQRAIGAVSTTQRARRKVHPNLTRGVLGGRRAQAPAPGTPGGTLPLRGRKLRAQQGSRLGSKSPSELLCGAETGGSPLTRLELRRQSFSSTRGCSVDANEIELARSASKGEKSQWPAPQGWSVSSFCGQGTLQPSSSEYSGLVLSSPPGPLSPPGNPVSSEGQHPNGISPRVLTGLPGPYVTIGRVI